MAYWARIDKNNIVDLVTTANDDPALAEAWLVKNLGGTWLQCSYNTRRGIHIDPSTGEPSEDQSRAFRGNYPGRGYEYHPDIDGFVEPSPFPSWVLNPTTYTYEAPTPVPSHSRDIDYVWDEDALEWVEVPITR